MLFSHSRHLAYFDFQPSLYRSQSVTLQESKVLERASEGQSKHMTVLPPTCRLDCFHRIFPLFVFRKLFHYYLERENASGWFSLLPLLEVLIVDIASPLLPVSKFSLQSHTPYLKNTSPSLHLLSTMTSLLFSLHSLLDISTWIYYCNFKFNIFKPKLIIFPLLSFFFF